MTASNLTVAIVGLDYVGPEKIEACKRSVDPIAHREFKERISSSLAHKLGKGGVFVEVKCAFDSKALAQAGAPVWRL